LHQYLTETDSPIVGGAGSCMSCRAWTKHTALFNSSDIRGGLRFFRWLSLFATITVLCTAWTNSSAPVEQHKIPLYSCYKTQIL